MQDEAYQNTAQNLSISAEPVEPVVRWGATLDDWHALSVEHGLAEDLLPVVSNPKAKVADYSRLEAVGKVPSRYNVDGEVVGIGKWTEKRATAGEIGQWKNQSDYGICIQTRRLRAIDVDIEDPVLAGRVWGLICDTLGFEPPRRSRGNSSKFLVSVWIDGVHPKRIMRLGEGRGIIEFLGNGQQFIAAGTHPSGSRYEWPDGTVPPEFPWLEPEEFEALWLRLHDTFGAEDERADAPKERAAALSDAAQRDRVARWLHENDRVLGTGRDGQLFVPCPNAAEHTTDSGPTATCYYPANTGGYAQGHWVCMHAHCRGKPDWYFTNLLDMVVFPDLTQEVAEEAAAEATAAIDRAKRFTPMRASAFLAQQAEGEWLVKGVLPAHASVTAFGPSGAGKSFAVTDIAIHVGCGWSWRGHRTRKGRVVYIVAEGRGGFGKRLRAAAKYYRVGPDDLNVELIAATPNMIKGNDAALLAQAIGKADLIVFDTQAAMAPGADENSAEISVFLDNVARIGEAAGATTLIVHHAGKDITRGQRGWSGLKAPLDVELEITRDGDARFLRLSKVRDSDQEGRVYGFRLEPVDLGLDADGDPITSAVVVPVGESPRAAGPKLGNVEQIVYTAAVDAAALGGRASLSEVVTSAAARLPRDPEKRDRRREVATRALLALARRGLVEVVDDQVVVA